MRDVGSNGTPRIGVYVCHCGTNNAGTVDVKAVADSASGLPGVVLSREYKYMCSDPGQELIQQDIRDHRLTRVIVATCSPLLHEHTFRHGTAHGGLNPYFLQMVNIRENVSWVNEDRLAATLKAKDLLRAAVYRVGHHKALERKKVPIDPHVLVVGGGIAGIHAALTLANAGKKVYLVEREPTIGGHMAMFDKTFPTLDCAACILTPKMSAVKTHPNITLWTYSEVVGVEGFVGNYTIKVKRKPRYIKEELCVGCMEYVTACTFKEARPRRGGGRGLRQPAQRRDPPRRGRGEGVRAAHGRHHERAGLARLARAYRYRDAAGRAARGLERRREPPPAVHARHRPDSRRRAAANPRRGWRGRPRGGHAGRARGTRAPGHPHAPAPGAGARPRAASPPPGAPHAWAAAGPGRALRRPRCRGRGSPVPDRPGHHRGRGVRRSRCGPCLPRRSRDRGAGERVEALRSLLPRLPDGLPPIAVVQHIPPNFSRLMAERLNDLCPFGVREAVDGDTLRPGLCLVAPGDFHLALVRFGRGYRARLTQSPPVHHCRPAVDVLFRSAAEHAGAQTVAVLLTGMGVDGARGMKALHTAGARTIAEHEDSCVVYGMPRAAVELGAASEVVLLEGIPDRIVAAVRGGP